MRMTQFSNFAIRIPMYTLLREHRPSAVPEMARAYGASYDHLRKAAAEPCRLGYLETARGRRGGFRLVKDPDAIRIGTIIRQTEGDVILVECFDAKTNNVPAARHLPRMGPPQEALAAVFAVLDGSTLAAPIRCRRCSAFGGMRAIREPRIRNRNLLSGSVSRTLGIS